MVVMRTVQEKEIGQEKRTTMVKFMGLAVPPIYQYRVNGSGRASPILFVLELILLKEPTQIYLKQPLPKRGYIIKLKLFK
jgi:hypothetical protein